MGANPRLPALAVALLFLVSGCGGDGSSQSASQTGSNGSTSSPSTSSAAGPSIVGEWQRLTTCQERVDALTAAGLGAYAAESVAGDGFIAGVTQAKDLKDPKHPCVGAIEQKHSHFFTADGKFGSRDANGQDVDDGTWRRTDSKTIIIGPPNGDTRAGTTFHFTITDNKILKLYPVMPACAKSGCFEAQWAVSVSYNGLPWDRIS